MAEKKKALTDAERKMKIATEREKKMQERVNVELYRDKAHTDPVYISVNGYKALIPRGKKVSIPRFAAEVLRQSREQDADTVVKIEELEKKFDESVRGAYL